MDEKELQKLYDAMSKNFDIGDFNSFKSRMQTTEQRKSFYDVMGKEGFDLGDYNQYEQRVGGVKKKETGGVFSKVGGIAGTSVPLSEEDKIAKALTTVGVSVDKTKPPSDYVPGFDQNDPLKSLMNPIRNKMAELRSMPVAESTGQDDLQRQQRSAQINDLIQAKSLIEKEDFRNEGEARVWLEPKLDQSKLVYKAGVDPMRQKLTLDDATEESIIKAVNPQNETDQLALRKYLNVRGVKEALGSSANLEQAALKIAAKKGGLTGDQISALDGSIPRSMKANILTQVLNDKNILELAENDAELTSAIQEEIYNLPAKYPEAAVTVLANFISKEREQMGQNNAILNLPSAKVSDEIVDALVARGDLPIQYKNMYENPGVRFMVNAKLKTPGLVENIGKGLEQSVVGIGKTIAEDTGIRSLYMSEQDKLRSALAGQYEDFKFKPKGLIHEISTSGGNVIGQILPTAFGGNALMAAKVVTNPTVANSIMIGLQSYGHNKDQARLDLPKGTAAEREAYALLNTAAEVATENIVNDTKLARSIVKGHSAAVKDIITKFTAKEITAAAAEKEYNRILSSIVSRATKGAKIAVGEANEELIANIANNVTKQVFTGQDMSVSQMADEAFEVWKTTLYGSVLLGGASAMRRNPTTQDLVYDMAANPEYFKDVMKGQASIDSEYAKDLNQKLSNLDHAAAIRQELDQREDLSDKQKKQFLVASLNEKILQDKAAAKPDTVLGKKEEKQIKEIEIEKEHILNPDMPNTQLVEEFYNEDLLPKGSMMLLEVEGKFNPSKVGEYLKFIAQQANNLDENWKPHEGKAPTMQVPDAIIDAANERWAKEIEAAQPKIDQDRELEVGEPEEISKPIELDPTLPEGYAEQQKPEPVSSGVEIGEFEKDEMLSMVDNRKDTVEDDPESAYGIESEEGALDTLRSKIESGDNSFTKGELEWIKSEADDLLSKTEAAIDADGNPEAKKRLPKIKKFVSDINKALEKSKPTSTEQAAPKPGLSAIRPEENRPPEVVEPKTEEAGDEKTPFAGSKIQEPVYRANTGGKFSQNDGNGVYFTTNKEYAELYTWDAKKGEKIEGMIVESHFIDLKNPLRITTKGPKGEAIRQNINRAKEEGYDGIIASDPSAPSANEILVFKDSQIKKITHKPKTEEAAKPEAQEPPPAEPTPPTGGIYVERPATELSFSGLQNVANEFGYEDVKSRERVNDIQERQNAINTANEWAEKGEYQKNVNDLLFRIENREVVPTAKQRLILEQYLAAEVAALRGMEKSSAEFDAQLSKVKRIKEIGNIARSEAGAALRLPDGGSRPHPVTDMADAMIGIAEANGVEVLTEKQKAEVEGMVSTYEKRAKEAEEKVLAMEQRMMEIEAAKAVGEIRKYKKAARKRTAEQLKEERSKILTSMKEKWMAAGKDTLSSDLPFRKQIAAIVPEVRKLVENLIESGVNELAQIVDNVHAAISDIIPEVEKGDIKDIIGGKYSRKQKRSELAKKMADLKTEVNLIDKLNELLKGEEPKSESKKIQRNQKIQELRRQIKDISGFEGDLMKAADEAISQKQKEAKQLEKQLSKAEKEADTAEAKAAKEEGARLEKERKMAEAERIRLEKEFEKEKQQEEKNKLKAKIAEAKRIEKQLSYRLPGERKLAEMKNRAERQSEEILAKIEKGDFEKEDKPVSVFDSKDLKQAFPREYKEMLDAIAAKEDAQRDYDIAVYKAEQAKRGKTRKTIDFFRAVIATTKAVKSGIDDSAVMMQNIVAMISHPRSAIKALREHALDAVSEKRFRRQLTELHNSPLWGLMEKSGLDITDPQSLKEQNKEEIFDKNLLNKDIKIGGKKYNVGKYLTRPFERAFTSLGNAMRVNMFARITEKWAQEGKTFETNPDDYKSLATLLNTQTGRGKLHTQIQRASELITSGIWSPRLMASRLNMLGVSDVLLPLVGGKGYYAGLTPKMREMAITDMVKFIGAGISLMALAPVQGADVDDDPESPTFGTIKVGDKKYNTWGGFTPYVKTFVQGATGKRKIDGEREKVARSKILFSFFRSRLTPAAGVTTNLLTGKDFAGKPVTAEGEALNLIAPLSVMGIIDGLKKDGMVGILNQGLPSFIGVGVSDERDFEKKDGNRPQRPQIQRPQKPVKQY